MISMSPVLLNLRVGSAKKIVVISLCVYVLNDIGFVQNN